MYKTGAGVYPINRLKLQYQLSYRINLDYLVCINKYINLLLKKGLKKKTNKHVYLLFLGWQYFCLKTNWIELLVFLFKNVYFPFRVKTQKIGRNKRYRRILKSYQVVGYDKHYNNSLKLIFRLLKFSGRHNQSSYNRGLNELSSFYVDLLNSKLWESYKICLFEMQKNRKFIKQTGVYYRW